MNQKNAPLTGWKLRLSQVVEITALFLIAVGLLRNVAEMVTDGALKGFPYVTLGSLLVFIASHRLSGRSFLPQKDSEFAGSKRSSGVWTLPSIGALFFAGVTQKLYGFGGFLGGVALFAGFWMLLYGVQWLIYRFLKKGAVSGKTELSPTEISRAMHPHQAHGAPMSPSHTDARTPKQ